MRHGLDLGIAHRKRVRLIRQNEVAECGLACIAMVANYHGYDITLGALRRRFQLSLRGLALKSLMGIADELALTPRALKIPLESLEALHLPAILHWDMTHFVVLERVAGGKALIHDPAGRSQWMTWEDVSPHFTGVALELRPSTAFDPVQIKDKMKLSNLWNGISGLKRALAQTIILSVVLEAFVLISPYYMQIAIDSALPALDQDLMVVLAIGFGLFTLINAVASLLRSFVLLSSGTALGYGVTTNIARRLLRLPIVWFEKREIGDVLSRFQSVMPIQQFLTQGAAATIIDGLLTIFTLVVMAFYSSLLCMISVSALMLYALVRIICFPWQRNSEEAAIVSSGKEQSMMIETLRGMVTLRMFNRETVRHAQWQSRLVDSVNAQIVVSRIGIWVGTSKVLIVGMENITTIWLSINFAIKGGFSVGMVFAYIAYKTQFLQRASSLIDNVLDFRMLGLHLERLSDIAAADQDCSVGEAIPSSSQLVGEIELRSISYRYSLLDPHVLSGIDIHVMPGEHIAITGPSGGGKSTLIKIILGLVEADGGDVLIDGKPISRFGYKNYRQHVAAVLQNDNLFSGTIADNIALFDDEPSTENIMQAAEIVDLHDDIVKMPMGYDTLVGDMGSSLSGGQQQRVLLARALYRKPRILVIDEGTSHLDVAREKRVNAAIAQLGVTRIIVAHRIETILSAQRVYEISGGRLREITDELPLPVAAYNSMPSGAVHPNNDVRPDAQ